MKALLIIDMQKVSFTPATPRYQTDEIIERINKLSESFRANNEKVIFIQHDGSKQNFCIPGSEEWEILDELEIQSSDTILSKTANDSFYHSDLVQILNKQGIRELIITGCATDFCVDATIKSALSKDYFITVISDAHTTADREGIEADVLINHYNKIWENMIPTNGNITVTNLKDFLKTS